MPPNIIIVTTDQQRKDSIRCYGSDFLSTPSIDRLAEEGIRFSRCYCTNPVCTPSRASLYSGKYVSRHGAWNVGTSIPEDEILLSHRLADRGYKTHLIGKAHFNAFEGTYEQTVETLQHWDERFPEFNGPYYGFDEVELALHHTIYGLAGHYGCWVREKLGAKWKRLKAERKSSRVFGGEAYDWDLPLEMANSLWTANRTVEFLDRMSKTNMPFFLSVGFQDPHHPHALPREYTADLDRSRFPLPSFNEGELDDKPPHIKLAHEGKLNDSRFRGEYGIAGHAFRRPVDFNFMDIPEDEAREGRAYYYGMVELIDKGMGIILDALDGLNMSNNTVVVFTTDHGDMLGDHGLWMKGPFHYEQLINVPFIMRYPGIIDKGNVSDELISLIDVVPTVLSLCGMEIPTELDGQDLTPLFGEDSIPVHDHVMIECTDDPNGLRLKTIVTGRYKLTYYRGEDFGELYDLVNDPRELTNLWDKETMKDIKIDLLLRLMDDTEKLEKRAKRYAYS